MLKNHLKIAIRTLLRHKNYTLINVVGLSLGLTGGLLIFVFVKFNLSVDGYHKNFDNIYRVVSDLQFSKDHLEHGNGSPYPMVKAIQNDIPEVQKASFIAKNMSYTVGIPKSTTQIDRYLKKTGIAYTDKNWFDIFDYQWIAGNPLVMNEHNTVVLTKKLAKKYFGDENPMGKTVQVNNKFTLKVAGVLNDYPENTDNKMDMFISMESFKTIEPKQNIEDWGWIDSNKEVFVLLKNNVASADFDRKMIAFSKKYHGADANVFKHHLQHLSDIHFNPLYRGIIRIETIWVLVIIGVFLVITACINFVNLATAQALKRNKEVGIRKLLGSKRSHLFWQFIAEVTLIVGSSLVLAIALTQQFSPVLSDWTHTNLTLIIDYQLVSFLVLLFALVILLSGFYPAFVLSGFNVTKALKGNNTNQQIAGFPIRRSLVVVQFTLSQLLIIGTFVVFQQMDFFKNSDLGFNKDTLLIIPVFGERHNQTDVLLNKLRQDPDVKNISFCFRPPADNSGYGGSIRYAGRDWEGFPARSKLADTNFLETFGIKLIAGRNIVANDSIREFLINEELVARLGIKDANEVIGKEIEVGEFGIKAPIVGVVRSFHQRSFHEKIEPLVIGMQKNSFQFAGIKLSGQVTSDKIDKIKAIWQSVYPENVFEFSFLDERIAKFYEQETMISKLLNVFALLVIFIGCLGLYGLVAFMAETKTKEIGIRKVLGASVPQILWLFGKEFAKLVIIAFLIASPVAWLSANQWLQNFAYRININLDIFVVSFFVTLLFATITVSYQATKSALMNPVKSLRTE